MPSIRLKVTRPGTNSDGNAMSTSVKPLFRGSGDTDYVCGNCGAVIASSMGPTQHVIVDTTVCAGCGAENEFPVDLRA
jgi:DNA-directed RNA polymerase subunit RPC12/RpoP